MVDPQNPPPLCNLYVSMLQRLGVEVIAADRYANAPAMQVAHRCHTLNMLDPAALRITGGVGYQGLARLRPGVTSKDLVLAIIACLFVVSEGLDASGVTAWVVALGAAASAAAPSPP